MAQDVFGIDTEIGGAWALEGSFLHLEDAADLVATSVGIQYSRVVSKFSPINQRKKYIATGEASGTLTLGAIIGPSKGIIDFVNRFGNACNVRENVISVQPAGVEPCEGDEFIPVEFKCSGCLLNSINVSVMQLGSGMSALNAGFSMMFTSLQMK